MLDAVSRARFDSSVWQQFLRSQSTEVQDGQVVVLGEPLVCVEPGKRQLRALYVMGVGPEFGLVDELYSRRFIPPFPQGFPLEHSQENAQRFTVYAPSLASVASALTAEVSEALSELRDFIALRSNGAELRLLFTDPSRDDLDAGLRVLRLIARRYLSAFERLAGAFESARYIPPMGDFGEQSLPAIEVDRAGRVVRIEPCSAHGQLQLDVHVPAFGLKTAVYPLDQGAVGYPIPEIDALLCRVGVGELFITTTSARIRFAGAVSSEQLRVAADALAALSGGVAYHDGAFR